MNGGVLKFFCTTRGFGFIRPDDGSPDTFVHVTAFQKSGLAPEQGMRLAFERAALPDGRVKAVRLRPEIALS